MFKFKVHVDFEQENEKELLEMYDNKTLLEGEKRFKLAKMDRILDTLTNTPYFRICGYATPTLAIQAWLKSHGIGRFGFYPGW